MKGLTLRRIADACGGILHMSENSLFSADAEVAAIVTDSRKAGEGSLFAAIRGERVDGHSFIPAVLQAGAAAVLTEQDLPEDCGGNWIKVLSTLAALRDIAEEYLRILEVPAVGIAGSVGKTSTKEMVAAVLSQRYRIHKTQGNFNNELGVPLTIFGMTGEEEIAVLEMGISDFGEMHRLAKIVRPDTCVMTNIGECHLEFLGDRDGVLRAKSEIFDFLTENGHIVLNGDDDKLVQLHQVNGVTPVFFGLNKEHGAGEDWPELSVWADGIESLGLEGSRCRIHTPQGSFSVLVPIPGRHMVMNALAGTAVGLIYNLTLEEIRCGIESLEPVTGRFHIIRTPGLTVIDDCYNANPVSMAASVKGLSEAAGRRIAVLGDMAELGSQEKEYHEKIGVCTVDSGIEMLFTVGERGAWIARKAEEEAARRGSTLSIRSCETNEECRERLQEELRCGDTVLVKASHCMKLEEIVGWLKEFAPKQ